MNKDKAIFVHEIKLPGKDEFAKRFNYVSDLFAIYQKEETDEAWENYASAKYCLEQGLPLPTLETKLTKNE